MSHYGRDDDGNTWSDGHNFNDDNAKRGRRTGGYGGFANNQEVKSGSSLNSRTTQNRSDPWRNGTRSRSRPGARPRTEGNRRIEEVLQDIQRHWDFMADDKCVPVQVALRLLDPSSLGLANRYDEFSLTSNQLQSALRRIVNEHHQGFNSSIGSFHKIQSSIQLSQQRVHALKNSLVDAKANLASAKPELKALAITSQNFDGIIHTLSKIEELQNVPDRLEAQISEKRFLSAVEVLQEAMDLIQRPEMDNIGALSDLKVYLSNQELYLIDILIEELHNHLYLKSPYCEDRFKAYTAKGLSRTNLDQSDKLPDTNGREIHTFLGRLKPLPGSDESNGNPEADTFAYLQLLVEALRKLDRLDLATDRIEQRLPVELFKIVEKSNSEVALRHPGHLLISSGSTDREREAGRYLGLIEAGILSDLLDTLYARFEAVAEGHRVVHEVISMTAKDQQKSQTVGFKGMWELYQSEIRSLLHDYLATDGNSGYRSGLGSSEMSVASKAQRDKTKKIFSLALADEKSPSLKSEKEDLEAILKTSVPGLVTEIRRPAMDRISDRAAQSEVSATGHKLLVESSVFNMGILLPPSLDFLNRLKDIVPPDSDISATTLTSFLDDFLVNVFHPQLEETLTDLCSQVFIEVDSFQQEPQWATFARKPIFKGTSRFFKLITVFCKMLDSLPHDQAFTHLLIQQMQTYLEKCVGWFKTLITRPKARTDPGPRVKASAIFSEMGDIKEVINLLWQDDDVPQETLFEREFSILASNAAETPLEKADVIGHRKNIAQICLLHNSMKWLAAKTRQLRHISDRATDSSQTEKGRAQYKRRWTMLASLEPSTDEAAVYLPLNQESAGAFDSVVSQFDGFSGAVLTLLRMESRCQILNAIHDSMAGTFNLAQPLKDPDQNVLWLNESIADFDEELSANFYPKQRGFAIAGLGYFLDQTIVAESMRVKLMNENGCRRMQQNIVVLQQNMRNVDTQCVLSRSTRFFDLFLAGPDEIVATASKAAGKDLTYSYEELKALIELCYSVPLASERREVAAQAQRNLEDHLLQLSEHLWQP